MEYIEKIKKMLCKELDEYAMKGKMTGQDLEMVWKLTDTVKNLDKIAMLEESEGYSETRGRRSSYRMGGSSYDDDMAYSEARGRGRYAKRDSLGRYSSESGMSYDDGSSYRSSYDGDSYRGGQGGYSKDDAKEHLMDTLGEAMRNASPKEREALKEAMRAIERA